MSFLPHSAPANASAPLAGRPEMLKRSLAALAGGAVLGALVALASPGQFLPGWLAAGLLSAVTLFFLQAAWSWAGRGRLLGWLVALAFLLRLGAGIGLSQAVQRWGYPETEQQAGYLAKDAYYRDMQAWDLARSGRPLWVTFRDEFASDQYGGLLALIALIYRYLSPDAHRPYLILILGSFFYALGVPFLNAAARLRWNGRVAALAAWIYVLYPDSIFFGGMQLREPFLIGLSAVAFWAVLAWDRRKASGWLALAGSLLGMALFSSRVAGAIGGFLALLFLLEYVAGRPERRWRILGWAGLAAGALLLVVFSWGWFRSSAAYDMLLTQRNSGRIDLVIKEIGEQFTIPVVIIYGVTQPVLPAAIADSSALFWRITTIIRSAGWYALVPFLAYPLFAVWREPDPARRRRAIWLLVTVVLWLVIASARGGGDQTDNPRYRSLFLVWMALLAAWSIDWALAHRDAWLWRWIAVEAIFLAFFTSWYVSRYFHIGGRLPFWQMILWIVALSGLVLLGGWVWDRLRAGKARSPLRVK